MSRDVRRELEEAGRRSVPSPEPPFADALEARLRAVVATGAANASAAPERRSRHRPRLPIAALGAGLAAVMLAAVAVMGPGPATPTPSAPALELSAAVNVVVQLADGTVIDNPDGLLLPEGATITVGDGGSARIGNTALQAGEVVVVQGGRLQVERPASVASHTAPGSSAEAGRTTSPTTRPSAAASGSQPGGTGRPTPTPAPTSTPGQSSGATPSPSATPAPSASPSPTPIPRPRLAASLVDPATMSVDWTRTPGAKQYILVITRSRTGTAPRPQYPGSRLQLTFTRPPLDPLRVKVPIGVVQVKLMVVALDANGVELARSRIARIDIPPLVPIGSPTGTASPAITVEPSPTPTPS